MEHKKKLDCIDSKKGCSNFYFQTSQEIVLEDSEEDTKVELAKTWRFHVAKPELIFAEYSVDLSAAKENFLGRETGSERHSETYLCVLEAVQD